MNAVELNATKFAIIQSLMTIDDEKVLAKISSLVLKTQSKEVAGHTAPCRYTVEEVRRRVSEVDDDIAAGRFVSHEEMGKQIASWR